MRITTRAAAAAGTLALTAALAACNSTGGQASAGAGGETTAAEPAETITVEHAQGSTEVAADPQRIVVFDMGTLDTLDTLGVENIVGVPQASVPSFLEEYTSDEYTDVGTLFEPDYEALARLEPDLVIVGGRSAAAYPDLAEHYPTVDASYGGRDANLMEGWPETALTIASIFGKEDEAQEHLDAIEQRIEEIRPVAEEAGTALVVQTSGGEITINGPESRFGLIFTDLGMTEAVEGVADATHGEVASFELIAQANPDWLFVNDRDAAIGEETGQAAEQILDNDLVTSTTAWQEDQVVYLDGERWYIVMHGLSNVKAMIDEVGTALQQ